MTENDRVFNFDAHSARGEYVAEGYSGVSLECWGQTRSWLHSKEIDWARLYPPVSALQILSARKKRGNRSRLDLACATCRGPIPVWLVMSCNGRFADGFLRVWCWTVLRRRN